MTKKELAKQAFKGKLSSCEGIDEASYVYGYLEGFNKAKELVFDNLLFIPLNKILDSLKKLGED